MDVSVTLSKINFSNKKKKEKVKIKTLVYFKIMIFRSWV